MTLSEARDSLMSQYMATKMTPNPIVGVKVGTYQERQVLAVYVNKMSPLFIPEESKPGVGYQGFEVVSFLGLNTMISDSGVISP